MSQDNQINYALSKLSPEARQRVENNIPSLNPANNELTQTPFSLVKVAHVQWLWHNRIAKGKVTIFAGEPGKGKSQLLLWLAAAISNGSKMPVDGHVFPQGKVAVLSAEDDADDTIVPRLMAVNANLANVLHLTSTPKILDGTLHDDMVRLDEDIQRLDNTFANTPGYQLLIIDPITAYLGNINDHKNSEVRTLITKLSKIAKKYQIAIILNTHFAKNDGKAMTVSAMNKVIGSIAYVAAARAAYVICDDLESTEKVRLFLPMKNNLGDDQTGFAYQVKPVTVDSEIGKISTCRIEWKKDAVNISANEALNKAIAPKRDEDVEFIRNLLKSGTQLLSHVRQQCKQNDISNGGMYRAKAVLNVTEDYTVERPRLITWSLPSGF